MYQFTTTTIINSNLDSNGTTAKYAGSATALNVTRVNKFIASKIVSVYKRPYAAGVKEVAKLTVVASTLGSVNRLLVDVRLSQKTDSEYANYSMDFKKPVVVEILGTGNATNDATAFKNAINGLRDRFGFAYITATSSGADLSLTATNNNQVFFSILQQEEAASYNSIIQPEYTLKAGGTLNGLTAVNGVVLTTVGRVGFGDDEYMISHIQIPTYENTRYFGTNKEERPIIGGNYTQYTLRYTVDKSDDGILAGAKSITTHVFYVLSTLQAAFETEVQKAFAGIVTIGGDQDVVIVGDQNVAASAGAITYTALNMAAGETVNWTNSTLTGTTSANTTGVLTVGSTAGTTTLTATGATSGKVGTLVITVV